MPTQQTSNPDAYHEDLPGGAEAAPQSIAQTVQTRRRGAVRGARRRLVIRAVVSKRARLDPVSSEGSFPANRSTRSFGTGCPAHPVPNEPDGHAAI
jgi:hypothetical protein